MRKAWPFLIGAAIVAAGSGFVTAQDARDGHAPVTTGALPPTTQAPPPWSGESGSSGHPLMTADAIRAAAENFHDCIERLWPAAAHRGVSRSVFQKYAGSLTPDLRIMDLLDNQPEFTKSFWDYLDILVTPERIEQGRALLEKYRSTFDAVERAYGVDRCDLGRRNQLRDTYW
jgi:membrane-bound lytic murein transglycosylase B